MAERKRPLRTATHTCTSSESAASANDVECCSGLQSDAREAKRPGGGRSESTGEVTWAPDAVPQITRPRAKRVRRVEARCRGGRAQRCRRSESCVWRTRVLGRGGTSSSSNENSVRRGGITARASQRDVSCWIAP
eukprot:4912148-Pleurochrysis_carterae.AAC.5